MWRAFWAWYERHYRLNVTVAAVLFALQLVHLYWLAADVIALRLVDESYCSPDRSVLLRDPGHRLHRDPGADLRLAGLYQRATQGQLEARCCSCSSSTAVAAHLLDHRRVRPDRVRGPAGSIEPARLAGLGRDPDRLPGAAGHLRHVPADDPGVARASRRRGCERAAREVVSAAGRRSSISTPCHGRRAIVRARARTSTPATARASMSGPSDGHLHLSSD